MSISAFQITEQWNNIKKKCCSTQKISNRPESAKGIKQKRLNWGKSQAILTILWFYSGKGKVGQGSKGLGFPSTAPEAAKCKATGAGNRPQDGQCREENERMWVPSRNHSLAGSSPATSHGSNEAQVKGSRHLHTPNTSSRSWNPHTFLTIADLSWQKTNKTKRELILPNFPTNSKDSKVHPEK